MPTYPNSLDQFAEELSRDVEDSIGSKKDDDSSSSSSSDTGSAGSNAPTGEEG